MELRPQSAPKGCRKRKCQAQQHWQVRKNSPRIQVSADMCSVLPWASSLTKARTAECHCACRGHCGGGAAAAGSTAQRRTIAQRITFPGQLDIPPVQLLSRLRHHQLPQPAPAPCVVVTVVVTCTVRCAPPLRRSSAPRRSRWSPVLGRARRFCSAYRRLWPPSCASSRRAIRYDRDIPSLSCKEPACGQGRNRRDG